jgi:hypothetical protein
MINIEMLFPYIKNSRSFLVKYISEQLNCFTMSIPSILNLPTTFNINTAMRPSTFSKGASGSYITLNANRLTNSYTLNMPPANAVGALFNDGLGNLRYQDPSIFQVSTQTIQVANTDNEGILKLIQLGTGDSSIGMSTPGQHIVMGIDQLDGNKFKISYSAHLGTNDIFVLSSTGAINALSNIVMSETSKTGSSGVFSMGTSNIYALNTDDNLFVGNNAGNLTYTTSSQCIGVGKNALQNITTSLRSIAIGSLALSSLTTGQDNICCGISSGNAMTTGRRNAAYGNSSLLKNIIGTDNCGYGYFSLFNYYGSGTCAFGSQVASGLFTGDNNSFFGNAITCADGVSNSAAFGNAASISSSNYIQFGNSSITDFGFASVHLTINQLKQLLNLSNSPSTLIGATQWNYLATQDQNISTTSSPTFQNLTVAGILHASITGNIVKAVNTITSNTTLNNSYAIVRVNATAGPISVTLPLGSASGGIQFIIKKIDVSANIVTILCQGSDTIDTASQTSIPISDQNGKVDIISDGSSVWSTI